MSDELQGGSRTGRRSKPKPALQTDARGSDATVQQSGSVTPLRAIGSSAPELAAVPVIGIGASAGGIEALGQFFDAMQTDSGCAFVVVLHLDPKRESELARILSVHTTMPVVQVEDGMRVTANHVYVIAPDTDLRVSDGGLHVSKPTQPRGHRHPVDVLFSSLAADQRERAIAIVLSGTGSNGTEGLRDIRAEGGMSLVQSPETAKFDGMPRSAISADMADHVLAPEQMPETLLAFRRHGYVAAPAAIEPSSPDGQATLGRLLELLRARGGYDFRGYKHSTLGRRVHRRLGLKNIETLDEYMDVLRTGSDEVTALAGDLMISVTAFFRDADAWKALAELVIAPIVAERKTGASIRVWVPACSTGEEAYTLAMLLTEHAEAAGKRFELKVFATDAQENNLRRARDGLYPAAAMAGFAAPRLRRFFNEIDGAYQVGKELRDMVVFAPQNLLRDPPFSRLDLVSCRNFLIYLEPDAQQRTIALCHFALRPSGYLFLGSAETIGRHEDLFETLSKKWRIYRRLGPTRHDLIEYHPRWHAEPGTVEEAARPSSEQAAPAEMARRALLERYAPASVLIDQKGRVLYFHGTTRVYLGNPPGEPTTDLLTMVRDGLGARLRAAIRHASKENRSATVTARIRGSKSGRSVAMTVMPLPASRQGSFMLVSFAPAGQQPDPALATEPHDAGGAFPGEQAVREELRATRAELQNTIEYQETTNEELKAAHEEATSVNEELQSTNEELETSKEELQSFNEELSTVNSQLQHKIGELEATTNDLNNLLAGSETATLFLDENLCIRWFSPATRDLFDFVASDIGRPVAHLARKFTDENLLHDVETVLKKLTAIEAEVSSDAGRWYARRVLPYRTQDGHIAGAVVTFSDITEMKLFEQKLKRLADTDQLTTLKNRRYLLDNIDLFASKREAGSSLALCLLDLDTFKAINDKFGHDAGDQVIRQVSDRILLATSELQSVIVARMGGDEFAVLLEVPRPSYVVSIVDKILSLLREPYSIGSEVTQSSASIGIASYPLDADLPRALLKCADLALYFAKNGGRNRYVFYKNSLNEEMEQRTALFDEARAGITRGEFEVYFQPIVRLKDKSLAGLEALVRWQHPTRGLLTPANFLPVMRDRRIGAEISQAVFHKVIVYISAWQREGVHKICVNLNVSEGQLYSPDFVDSLCLETKRLAIDPKSIKIEVTEDIVIDDTDNHIFSVLTRLRDAGFFISLDDFGTGYGSLSHMSQFPLDEIKIDISFVRELSVSPKARAVVRFVTQLAHELGFNVVAEGIENVEIEDIVATLGCDDGQGYFFGRPQPASVIPDLIRQWSSAQAG